jgi:hypothetical protein
MIAKAVSRSPRTAATIVPYDVRSRISEAFPNTFERRISGKLAEIEARMWQGETRKLASYRHPEQPSTAIAIDKLIPGRSATIEGRVSQVEDLTQRSRTSRSMVIRDDSGQLRIAFRPGHGGGDILPGQLLRITGAAHRNGNSEAMMMADPAYQLVR